jgi:hypothetical protein
LRSNGDVDLLEPQSFRTFSIDAKTIPKKTDNKKLKYDQDSAKVPNFYSRPGPGMYENNKNLDKLSKFSKSTSITFGTNYTSDKGPQHRF